MDKFHDAITVHQQLANPIGSSGGLDRVSPGGSNNNTV